MVPDFHVIHPLSNTLDNTSTLMSQNDGESSLRVFTRERVCVTTLYQYTAGGERVIGQTYVWQIPVLDMSAEIPRKDG